MADTAKRPTTDDYFDEGVRDHPMPARAFRRVLCAIIWFFSKLYWRWTLDGPDPFAGGEGASTGRVLVGNHASMLDPVVIVAQSNVRGRPIRALYKSELDSKGFVQWFLSRVGGIPIKRGTADMKGIRRASNALKRGEDLLVFPEGTRVWDPAARPEIHGGFALIAQMANADIVPFAIDGSELICPDKHGFPKPAKVRVRFGEPFGLAEVAGLSRREQTAALETIAMDRVYAMRRDLRLENGKPVAAADDAAEGGHHA